jgi:hypothetical protein
VRSFFCRLKGIGSGPIKTRLMLIIGFFDGKKEVVAMIDNF